MAFRSCAKRGFCSVVVIELRWDNRRESVVSRFSLECQEDVREEVRRWKGILLQRCEEGGQ